MALCSLCPGLRNSVTVVVPSAQGCARPLRRGEASSQQMHSDAFEDWMDASGHDDLAGADLLFLHEAETSLGLAGPTFPLASPASVAAQNPLQQQLPHPHQQHQRRHQHHARASLPFETHYSPHDAQEPQQSQPPPQHPSEPFRPSEQPQHLQQQLLVQQQQPAVQSMLKLEDGRGKGGPGPGRPTGAGGRAHQLIPNLFPSSLFSIFQQRQPQQPLPQQQQHVQPQKRRQDQQAPVPAKVVLSSGAELPRKMRPVAEKQEGVGRRATPTIAQATQGHVQGQQPPQTSGWPLPQQPEQQQQQRQSAVSGGTMVTLRPGSRTSSSSAQQPVMTDSDEKRLKRLARNREAARLSRRRKKQQLEHLQEKVNTLNEEFDSVKKAHVEMGAVALRQAKLELLQRLNRALGGTNQRTASSEREVKGISRNFGPFCEERQALQSFQFSQLRNVLMPPHKQLLLWLLQQDDDFFKMGREPTTDNKLVPLLKLGERLMQDGVVTSDGHDNMWPLLGCEIQLKHEQEEKFRKSQPKLKESLVVKTQEARELSDLMDKVGNCEAALSAAAEAVHHRLERVHSVLTPTQIVRLHLWLEKRRDVLFRRRSAHTGAAVN